MKNRVPRGHWQIKENCIAEAKKYSTKIEWRKECPSSYNAAYKNGWMDECCAHMINLSKPSYHWQIKENCIADAKKYKTKTEWGKKSPKAWGSARKNGWMDECCAHMEWNESMGIRRPKGYWDIKENCIADAKKYKTRNEWKKNSSTAWSSALKNGWMDECCAHMERIGSFYERLVYVYIFPDNHVYVGLTCNEKRRKNQHTTLGNKKHYTTVYEYMVKTNQIPKYERLSDYVPKDIACDLENYYIEKYKNEGYIVLNKTKGGSLGGSILIWTKERCIEDAKGYRTKSEWKKNSGTAYNSARKNGWMDECCAHMVSFCKPRDHWQIKENCIEDAKQYKTRSEWARKSSGAYDAAHKNGWLDECCAHMISPHKPTGYWKIKENCILDAKQYKTRNEWRKNSGTAYNSARKNGWLDECFPPNKSMEHYNIAA